VPVVVQEIFVPPAQPLPAKVFVVRVPLRNSRDGSEL
jgi:hypothetical protein